MSILADTAFTPYDTSGGVLPMANNRVESAFGAFPQWEQPPMSFTDLLRMQAQPQPQPQMGANVAAGGILPRMEELNQPPMPQQQPMQQPMAAPGFGDRLSAGLMGFANSGAPIPAVANLISGLLTGQRSDVAGQQQQAMMATYRALKAAGVSDAEAQAGALNPDALKIIAPELYSKPQWGVIGQDILGRPQYGWINAKNQTVTPAGGASAPGVAGMQGIDESKPIYDQLPKPQQAIVDSMLAGRQQIPSSFALKTPYWNTLLAAANERAQANGSLFDATTWAQRNKAASDLSPNGTSGKTIAALDTVQGHIGDKLVPAIDKLEKTGIAPNVPVANWLQNLGADVAPSLMKDRTQAVTAFNNARKAVVDEMGKAYKGGLLSDHEVKEWSALIKNTDSIIKLRETTADFVDLLNTKRQQLIGQYAGLNVPFKGANEEENKRITKLVHDRNAGPAAETPTAPQMQPLKPGKYQWTPQGGFVQQ